MSQTSIDQFLNMATGILPQVSEFTITFFTLLLTAVGSILIFRYVIVAMYRNWSSRKFRINYHNNAGQYEAKRCRDEGDVQEGRDHIYLVNHCTKEVHRVANRYTLHRLGYPRPPRVQDTEKNEKFYFSWSDGYRLGKELEIEDILSALSTLNEIRK